MSIVPIASLTLGAIILGQGLLYMTRPESYVGKGIPPATDPRTVLIFGRVLTLLGAVTFLLNLILLFSE